MTTKHFSVRIHSSRAFIEIAAAGLKVTDFLAVAGRDYSYPLAAVLAWIAYHA